MLHWHLQGQWSVVIVAVICAYIVIYANVVLTNIKQAEATSETGALLSDNIWWNVTYWATRQSSGVYALLVICSVIVISIYVNIS